MGASTRAAELRKLESEQLAKLASELGHGTPPPPPGWDFGVAPSTLLHLELWLEKKLAEFRDFPKTSEGYFRETYRSADGSIIKREPRPRSLAGRLAIAQLTIDNAHRWLDSRTVSGKPAWPRSLPDVETAERSLSELRDFVGSLRNQYQADPVLEPIRDAIQDVMFFSRDGRGRDHRDAVTLLTRALKKGRSICPRIVTAEWASEVATAAYAILTPDRDSAIRKLLAAQQHLWNATQFGSDKLLDASTAVETPRKKPAGRKRGGQPKYDPTKDDKLVERLKASGKSAKDFASTEGMPYREVKAARERVRKRKAKRGTNAVKAN